MTTFVNDDCYIYQSVFFLTWSFQRCVYIWRKQIYWSKVLTDEQGLCRFFRKHKIVKNLKTATIKQVIIYLSNLLKCFFRKSHYVFFFFGQKMESTLPKYAPSFSQLLIITCIGHSRSHFLPLDLNGKKC